MKKIQPKIFIDTEVSLVSGFTLIDGYSIGQVIHFNNTGNEFYHKTNGVWQSSYGSDGTSGSSGINGTNGTSGSSGANGNNGTSGSSGINGTNGTSGSSGSSGSSGAIGTSGSSGTSGLSGLTQVIADTLYNKISDNVDPYLYVNTKDEISTLLKNKADNMSPVIYHSLSATTFIGTISTNGVTVTCDTSIFNYDLINARLYIGTEYRTVTSVSTNLVLTVDNPYSQNYPPGTSYVIKSVALQFSNSVVGQYVMFQILNNNGGLVIGHSYDRVTLGDYKFGDGNNNCAYTPSNMNAFQLAPDKYFQWYDSYISSANALATTPDVGLRRNSAGTLELFDGVTSNNDGNIVNRRDLLVRNLKASIVDITSVQTTLTGTTGSVIISQPFIGASYKKVILYFTSGLTGNFSYTYPIPFLYIPNISGSGVPNVNSVVATITSISLSGTNSSTPGFIILEGF